MKRLVAWLVVPAVWGACVLTSLDATAQELTIPADLGMSPTPSAPATSPESIEPSETPQPPKSIDPIRLVVTPTKHLNAVDERIHGHFLEHIFHSVNGGLWGEMVFNRSFEENDLGQWHVEGETIVQSGQEANQRLTFGDTAWSDYEFTLEAEKIGGREGFLVLFRVKNDQEFYWANLGGWSNQQHALERGDADQPRWGRVGPTLDGSIESDRWYRIRVRCEGHRMQVWLDDALLIDFTDEDGGAHLTGRVGVGTWSTHARFRNLKVVDIEEPENVLFEGLPDTISRPTVGRHWKPFGEVDAVIEADDAPNGRFCQHLLARTGGGGLKQTPLSLRKGEIYHGGLWVHGKADQGLDVRLLDRGKTVLNARLPSPSDEWSRREFTFFSNVDVADATLQVGTVDEGDIRIDQISLMAESSLKTGGFRPDLLEAITALRPPVIRWPGGCFASPYRWRYGIGEQEKRQPHPMRMWDDVDVNSFGTDEFLALCRRVGAEPLIVVNIGTAQWNGDNRHEEFLQEVLDWIEYCNGPPDSTWGKVRAANGHPEPYGVKYWEIDNETWHMGAEAYAEQVLVFAEAMRQADPSIDLIACGSGGFNLEWNKTIIGKCAGSIDYLSLHHYEDSSRYAEGPAAFEAFFHQTAELIAASPNPDLKLYVSEWNAFSTDWRSGLYCAGLLNAFERSGDFLTMAGPALFLRHVSATAWDNAFVNFDHRTWFPAPNYVVMKLWRDHYDPTRIDCTGNPGPLNLVATVSADATTVHVKAVNPSDTNVPVELTFPDTFVPTSVTLELIAPGSLEARNTLVVPHAVTSHEADAVIDGETVRYTLPPLSAGVATISK